MVFRSVLSLTLSYLIASRVQKEGILHYLLRLNGFFYNIMETCAWSVLLALHAFYVGRRVAANGRPSGLIRRQSHALHHLTNFATGRSETSRLTFVSLLWYSNVYSLLVTTSKPSKPMTAYLMYG